MTLTSWPAGRATGVGSLPGTEVSAAWNTVLKLVGDFPFVPELPERGPGADMIGRGLAISRELPVDLQPSGWRLVPRPGRDFRRGRDFLARDLDAAEQALDGYRGPLLLSICGPWSLAASVELGRGGPALADAGAVRDIGGSVAEGAGVLIDELRRRIPGAELVVSVDEPSLPSVLSGRVHTASGFDTVRSVEPGAASALLAEVVKSINDSGALPMAHCCAPHPPIALLGESGVRAIGADVTLLGSVEHDALGECIDSGVGFLAGVLPTAGSASADHGVAAAVARFDALWSRLGFDADQVARTTSFSPACGLAGNSPSEAAGILTGVAGVARRIGERTE